MTGTLIESDKKIAVLSGAKWTSVIEEFLGDHLVLKMTPTNTSGVQFVTVPIATRKAGDNVRILGMYMVRSKLKSICYHD